MEVKCSGAAPPMALLPEQFAPQQDSNLRWRTYVPSDAAIDG
jgi:hypothetical protein